MTVVPRQVIQTQRSHRLSARRPVSQIGRGIVIPRGPSLDHGDIDRSRGSLIDHGGIERSWDPSINHGGIDRPRRPSINQAAIDRSMRDSLPQIIFGANADPLTSSGNRLHQQIGSDSFRNSQISPGPPEIPQINPDTPPWSDNVQLTPTETDQHRNTWMGRQLEQQQILSDDVVPDLLKTNAIQRQRLPMNTSFDRLSQTAGQIPVATSPFLSIDSMSTTTGNQTASKICEHRCNEHSDCNDLFTYCINKIPCSGKVCHRVT